MDGMPSRTITADRGDAGHRLDLVLRRRLADVDAATRTRIQAWIARGQVTVNGDRARRASSRAAMGDRIIVSLPEAAPRRKAAAEAIDLDVLFEDEHLLVVNKPAGLIAHPTFRRPTGTVMNALLWRARRWPAGRRPSLVGRLDTFTSGAMLVAKTAALHAALQRAMAANDSGKEYLAVVYGRVKVARGRIDAPLARDPRDRRRVVVSARGGAPSITRFERLARAAAPRAGLALLRCTLITGRMHQIRVHLASRGWPIVGDSQYGGPRWSEVRGAALTATLRDFPRQALHAWRLAFVHPITRARVEVEAPVPDDMARLLAACGLRS